VRVRLPGLLLLAALLAPTGCSSTPSPEPAARAFLDAWSRGDLAAAARATDGEPAAVTDVLSSLGSSRTTARLSSVGDGEDDRAQARFTASHVLPGLPQWEHEGSFQLRRVDDRWLVRWAPAVVHPDLRPGERLGTTRSRPERAAILDGAGRPLVAPGRVVTIGLVPGRLTDRAAALAAVSKATGASAERVGALVQAAQPTDFVPAITLRESDFRRAEAQLRPVPGVVFREGTASLAPTPTFARALLGRVGPVNAEQLAELNGAQDAEGEGEGEGAQPGLYLASDSVGQSGLQAAYEKTLAGTPSGTVVARSPAGDRVLARLPGAPGTPLATTLDRQVQEAAEAALATVTGNAALVAIRPSNGHLLAAVSRPGDSAYDRALVGRYPPGSTFKV